MAVIHLSLNDLFISGILLLSIFRPVFSSWWLLGTSAVHFISTSESDTTKVTAYQSICRNLNYLGDKQKQLCIADQNVLKTVILGAATGIAECQKQFQEQRWNCSLTVSSATHNSSEIFGPVLNINSREKAFVYAISSAGVAHAVTKACSQGEIANCGCDERVKSEPTNGRFHWGGCSDDVTIGERFSRDFVDTKETLRNPEGLMNLHNNEAGRQHVRKNMQTLCKCHGVSGSCSVQFCWKKLSGFNKIGDSLGAKFESASHVRMNWKKRKLKPKYRGDKAATKDDLVYLDRSPDYCERNAKYGIGGTKGRKCNKTSRGIDGCSLMCCGRGYRTKMIPTKKDCRCKFVWCCSVKCETCIEQVEEHFCN